MLPYAIPIMQATRALAATLVGTQCDVAYPAMPVIVKTPTCPIVVAPPVADFNGTWQVDMGPDGFRALHHDDHGVLTGFALGGSTTRERNELARKIPAWLS